MTMWRSYGAGRHTRDTRQARRKTGGASHLNKQQSGNALAIAEAATNVVEDYADNPDFTMALVANQGKLIEDSVMNVASSLIYGGLLAVLVLWVILGQLKLAGIIGTAIPISVMATFLPCISRGLL
jgi:HAE1 family hydrophobic/amphiphilic exporter-1